MANISERPPAPKRIGMVQMCSRNNKDTNFDVCRGFVKEAALNGCQLVAFPECFSFIGAKAGEAQAAAEPLEGPTIERYRNLAREHSVWLSLGGFQELPSSSEDPSSSSGKIFNTHVIVDAGGDIRAAYRKIHLFDAPFVGLVESRQAIPGKEVISCESPVGTLGVTVCYDVRFPQLYQRLRFDLGCEVILVPSAFSMETGEAHWETLLRARAVENQCYVIAAAQAGLHNDDGNKRQSWGHSLAIDPWGKVLASMDGESVGLRIVDIEPEVTDKVRSKMPLDTHRRYNIYGGTC